MTRQHGPILDLGVRLLYPLLMVAAVWLLLRGHNEPGGGFIGGMVAVAASSLLAIVRGADTAVRMIPFGSLRFASAGVLLAALSGLPAVLLGEPYMTHQWGSLPLGEQELKVSTVLLFDGGVFAAVWGGLGTVCARLIGLEPEKTS